MVEAIAVAAGTSGAGATTSTLALGLALAEEHEVTLLDPAAGLTELLVAPADIEGTLQDVLLTGEYSVDEVSYERHGIRLIPCGAALGAFETAKPTRIRDAFATVATDTDLLLIDSPALLDSSAPTLPIVVADRIVVVLEPTLAGISDGLKVQEYAHTYGTKIAGVLFNKIDGSGVGEQVVDYAERYFEGPVLGSVPESSTVSEAHATEIPLLAYAPESPATNAFRSIARSLTIQDGSAVALGTQARRAIIPKRPQ